MSSPFSQRVLLALIGLLAIASIAQTVNSILAQRRADRLEQLLRESAAARAPATPPAVVLAAPRQPEAQRFVREAGIDQATWDQLVAINREWLAALAKSDQGADLDAAARNREARLRAVLAGTRVTAARFSGFESGLAGEPRKARSASGNEYEGAAFE